MASVLASVEASRDMSAAYPDSTGYIECPDCGREIHGESDEAVVLLGVARCPGCTLFLALQIWLDPALLAQHTPAEQAEILSSIAAEAGHQELEIRERIRAGRG
jgi:hypothetical protein